MSIRCPAQARSKAAKRGLAKREAEKRIALSGPITIIKDGKQVVVQAKKKSA